MSKEVPRTSDPPLVSVVMPAYDAERFVGEAVESLLSQSFGDLEVVVVDDGSRDGTVAVLDGFADPRLVVLRHGANRGISAALNTGLEAVRGELIAFQDADDVSLPERLAEQVALFDARPELAVAGSAVELIDEGGAHVGFKGEPPTDTGIRWRALFTAPFVHSTQMVRGAIVRRHGLRHPDVPASVDYPFSTRLLEHGTGLNDERALVRRRLHGAQLTALAAERQDEVSAAVLRENFARLGIEVTEDDARRLRGFYYDPPLRFGAEEWRLTGLVLDAAAGLARRPGIDRAELRGIVRGVIDSTLARSRRDLRGLAGAGLAGRLLRVDPAWTLAAPVRQVVRRRG